jgi:hypothetical protein
MAVMVRFNMAINMVFIEVDTKYLKMQINSKNWLKHNHLLKSDGQNKFVNKIIWNP